MKKLILCLVLLGAASCGSLAQNQPLVSAINRVADARSGIWQAQRDPRPELTREVIDAAPNNLLLFAPINEEVASVFAVSARNQDMLTWVSDRNDSLTLQDGLLVATRGLGNDLMGADLGGVYRALVKGSGRTERIHAYLDGEDQIEEIRYVCEVATLRSEVIEIIQSQYQTRVVSETCRGGIGGFRNLYWIDDTGIIRQSRQSVSVGLGAVDIQIL